MAEELQTNDARNGSDGFLLVSLDGQEYSRVEELVGADFTDTEGRVTANSHKFRRREQTVPGRDSGQLTINCNLLARDKDPGGRLLRQAKRDKLPRVYLKVLTAPDEGADRFDIIGSVGGMTWGIPDGAVQPLNFTFNVNAFDDTKQVTAQDLLELGDLPD